MPDDKKNKTFKAEIDVSDDYKGKPNFIDIKINQYPKEPAAHGVETGDTTEIIVDPDTITINDDTKEVEIKKTDNKNQQPPDHISTEKHGGIPNKKPTTNPYK